MRNYTRYNFIRRGFCAALSASLCLTAFAQAPARVFADAGQESGASHIHTESCYSVGNHLVCELEEGPGHQHTDSCYGPIRGELWCTDITGEHMHNDDSYTWTPDSNGGDAWTDDSGYADGYANNGGYGNDGGYDDAGGYGGDADSGGYDDGTGEVW